MKLFNLLKNNYVLIALFFVNAIIKIFYVSAQPIGLDEPFSIFHAQCPISSIFSNLLEGNNPPLFEIILHYWISIFGIGTLSVRMVPYLFSILSLPVLYKLTQKLYTKETAILASILFMFSSIQIYFGYEVRVYSLFVFLTLISQYVFVILKQNPLRIQYKILFVIVNILLIYAHYFGFIVLLIQGLTILLSKAFRKNIISYLYLYGIILLCFSPLFIYVYKSFVNTSGNGTWLVAPNGIKSLYYMLIHFCNSPVSLYVVIAILLGSLLKKSTYASNTNILIVLWLVVPLFGMFAISYVIPMYIPRYLIFASPALYILVSHKALVLCNKKIVSYILAGIVALTFIFSAQLNSSKYLHELEAATYISECNNQNSFVLVTPKYYALNFAYNYDIEVFENSKSSTELINALQEKGVRMCDEKSKLDLKYLQSFDTLIYFDAGMGLDLKHEFKKANFHFLNSKDFGKDFSVSVYIKNKK